MTQTLQHRQDRLPHYYRENFTTGFFRFFRTTASGPVQDGAATLYLMERIAC